MKYCPACKADYPDSERFCPTEGRLLSLPDPYHLVGRTLLEKYRIEALVGLGGMGAVYSGRHLTINRHVAIKILQPNLALGNERLLELFQREAEMAGRLNHENIVDIKDAGRTPENIAYIVMEWLEGRTLEEEIEKSGQIGFERAAAILQQVAAALDHAHARHIIHRDLKPANIMLVRGQDGREQVKVVDFGIAKVVSESANPGANSVSLLLGTPHYASPEQFIGGSRLDGRSDIYSLGVVLYRMLCGNLPYTAPTLQDLIRLQRTALPPPIRQYRPETPEIIERLLFHMLDLDPRNRPPRALDAFDIFARSLNEEEDKTGGLDMDWPTTSSGIILPAGLEPSSNRAEGVHVSDTAKDRIVATDKNLPARTVAARAAASLPQTVRVEELQAAHRKALAASPGAQDPKKYAIAAALVLAIFAGLSALYFGMIRPRLRAQTGAPAPAPISGDRVELMSYYLDITSEDCRTLSRGTGDESLLPAQSFRFHFITQRSGYLYIIAQNRENVPMTFLTAQPDPETGVRTNFVEAGSDYSFPSGDGACIEITGDERMMAFTLILSPMSLASPGFLAAPAGRKLTATEQHQFNDWRLQRKSAAPQIRPDAKHQLTRVTIANESAITDQPVIFDLPIKRR
jgi:serine/threonine protein kinase